MKTGSDENPLDTLYIARPCNIDWDDMPGTDRVHSCAQCSKNVYNIADMTTQEAKAFLAENGVTACMRIYGRHDGSIMTDDCPAALRKIRDRLLLMHRVAAATIGLLISTTGLGARASGTNDRFQFAPAVQARGVGPNRPLVARQVLCVNARAIGAAILLMLSGLATPKVQTMPVNIYRNFYDDHGLTDLQGKELVPAIYPDISYVGHGLFLVRQRKFNARDRSACIEEKLLINRKGIDLRPEVPPDTTFEKVLWLGEWADNDPDFVPDKIPNDALLVFKCGEYFGICDKAGGIVAPASLRFIGIAREDKAVLRDTNGQLSVFDVKSKEKHQICCDDEGNGISMTFSDGLAAFRNRHGSGYIDSNGKFAIEPRYRTATGFVNGRAFVTISNEDGVSATGVIIDKTGNVISPQGLSVSCLCGDYAVCEFSKGHWGTVDRNFNLVIQPKFTALQPQTTPIYSEYDAWVSTDKAPLFYYAAKDNGEPPVVLSVKGDVLFKLPKGAKMPVGGFQWFHDGIITCIAYPNGAQRKIYVDMHGNEVPAPFSNLSKSPSVNFYEIAPGVLLKTIKCSDESYKHQRVD